MITTVAIYDKQVRVKWSRSAHRQLQRLENGLIVDMELLFSCLVKKHVYFDEGNTPRASDGVLPDVQFRFRATITSTCDLSREGGAISHQHTPIPQSGRFIPDWCAIDYVDDTWRGEFGYDAGHASLRASQIQYPEL